MDSHPLVWFRPATDKVACETVSDSSLSTLASLLETSQALKDIASNSLVEDVSCPINSSDWF